MQPFRHLLSSSTPFEWTKDLNDKFEKAKVAIVEAVEEGVESFSMDRDTILAVYWVYVAPEDVQVRTSGQSQVLRHWLGADFSRRKVYTTLREPVQPSGRGSIGSS